jgi:hypothetical protein
VQRLELCRSFVSQRLVNALAVVEQLDVVKDLRLCLLAGSEVAVVHQFVLQVLEEAIRHRIAVGALSPTHAPLHASALWQQAIAACSIEHSAISVMD